MNIQEHCLENNFYFDDDTLFNFHCCLKTKPFTILYGPSGTGKSKIGELYADYICSKNGLDLKNHLCFVPVRPNWTSPSDLVGFYDYLNGAFIPSEFYNFMKQAEADSTNPYFVILDEMNLSVVEHYFSDFLSCIESRRLVKLINHNFTGWQQQVASQVHTTLSQATILAFLELVANGTLNFSRSFDFSVLRDHNIVNQWKVSNFGGQDSSWKAMFRTEFNQKDDGNNNRLAGKFFECIKPGVYRFNQQQNYSLKELSGDIVNKLLKNSIKIEQHGLEIYKHTEGVESMEIPLNLYVIGTINMDESTHPLSSKVLDRANTIEMNKVSKDILTAQSSQAGVLKIDNIDYSFSEVTSLATLNSAKELNIKNSVLIDLIYKINDGLIQYQTNMGHRSIFEMAHYINNYIEIMDISFAKDSLDFQFCQKLIPKLMGSDERIEKSILHTVKIITNNEIDNGDKFLANNLKGLSYPKTLNKLQRMYKYYMQNGFVNFANV